MARMYIRTAALFALLILLAVALGFPLLEIMQQAIFKDGRFSIATIMEAFSSNGIGDVVANTAIVVAISSVLATILGVILALVATKLPLRGSWAFRVIPLVPLTIAPVVGAVGWVFLLAPRTGWINTVIRSFIGGTEGPFNIFSVPGAIWVTTLYIVPYVFATMASALDRTSADTLEAFMVFGTNRIAAVLRVVTGVLRPAFLAGFILAILESATQFSVPLILDVHVLTTSIYDYVQHASPARRDLAAALALLILLFGAVLTVAEFKILGNRQYTSVGGRGLSQQKWSLGLFTDGVLAALAVLYLIVSVVLPTMAILLVSFLPFWKPVFKLSELTVRNYADLFKSSNFIAAMGNSLYLAAVGTVAIICISLLISLTQARYRSRIGQALHLIGNLPLGVPGVVLGLGALILFTSGPIPLYGTIWALILAYIVHFLPLGMRNIDPVVQQVGASLEEAARTSGANPARVLLDVTLPLILPGIIAAAAVSMILIMREFPISSLLSTPTVKVVSVYLVNSFENGVFSQVAAMAVVLSIASMIGVVTFQLLGRRVRFGSRGKPIASVNRAA